MNNYDKKLLGGLLIKHTSPPKVIAELDGKDAEVFIEYNTRDLNNAEQKCLVESHNLYVSKKKH
jgi:hypothetical protein